MQLSARVAPPMGKKDVRPKKSLSAMEKLNLFIPYLIQDPANLQAMFKAIGMWKKILGGRVIRCGMLTWMKVR